FTLPSSGPSATWKTDKEIDSLGTVAADYVATSASSFRRTKRAYDKIDGDTTVTLTAGSIEALHVDETITLGHAHVRMDLRLELRSRSTFEPVDVGLASMEAQGIGETKAETDLDRKLDEQRAKTITLAGIEDQLVIAGANGRFPEGE